jgi:uncharacterized protein YdhG (YjbR/CyaY superfamily)
MIESKGTTPSKIYRSYPKSHRKTILEMRRRILAVIPDAEEVVSYGMPAFKYRGHIVAGPMAAKNHIGFYPFSGSVLPLFEKELRNFKRSRGALHVPIGTPLSKTLIRKLLRARISQCPVKRGEVDLSKYSKDDAFWQSLGLAAPARRGLVDKKLLKLSDLKRITDREFHDIHAIGPSASRVIIRAMKRNRISFKSGKVSEV